MINVEELRKIREKKEKVQKETFDKMLGICYKRIKAAAINGKSECYYEVPEFIFGLPKYKLSDCCKYLIKKIGENDFDEVKWYKPNVIYVKW